jgi:hypothetical protein
MPRRKLSTRDLAEPITAQNFDQTMQALYPDNLRKEVYWTGEEPSQTLYRWFYDYVRAAREISTVRDQMAADPGWAQAMAETDQLWGDLGTDFLSWWDAGGEQLFSEHDIPRVKVLNGRPDQEQTRREVGLLVGIPLHVSREILLEQLNFVLAAYHPADALRRHEYSTAAIKLFPRERYPATDYEFLLKIWRAARPVNDRGEQVKWWRVYAEASGLAQETIEQLERNEDDDIDARDRMARSAKKIYKQAERLIRNAVIGQFPRDE